MTLGLRKYFVKESGAVTVEATLWLPFLLFFFFAIGELALQVISAIHTVAGCDFTLLVADDNGSGKLVEWYERNGFSRAPKLQDMMGSPGGKFGITMIAPTQLPGNFFEQDKVVRLHVLSTKR